MQNKISDSLKEILNTGMTQADLATYLGVTQGTVSKILNGRMSKISYETGKKIELMVSQLDAKKISGLKKTVESDPNE